MRRYRIRADGKTERRKKGKIGGPFTPLLNDTLDSEAWRALSHGAARLYISLKRRYSIDQHNNGRIFLSYRGARAELGIGFDSITRWFRELQYYGFIVQTSSGCLGLDGKGKAPHWRLTELGYMRDEPTRDFRKWNGQVFKNRIPHPLSVQSAPETGCSSAPVTGAPNGRSAPETGCIEPTNGAPIAGAYLNIPSVANDADQEPDDYGDENVVLNFSLARRVVREK